MKEKTLLSILDEDRVKNKHIRFGRDYYIKEAAKATGARNAKDVDNDDAISKKLEDSSNETSSNAFIFKAVPAIVEADGSYHTDSESLIEIGSPVLPTILLEISSDSDLSIERTYNLTSGKVYEKIGNIHKEIIKRTSSPEGLKFTPTNTEEGYNTEMVDENHNSMTSDRKRLFLRSLTNLVESDVDVPTIPNNEVICEKQTDSNIPKVPLKASDEKFVKKGVESVDYVHNKIFSVQEVSMDFSTESEAKTSAESSLNSTPDAEIGDLKDKHLVKDRLGQFSKSYPNLSTLPLKKSVAKLQSDLEDDDKQKFVTKLQNGFEGDEKCDSHQQLPSSEVDSSVTDLRKKFAPVQVVADSVADRSGLQVSDVVVRINDKSTANCTHAEAHELILEDEHDLIFAVRRDYYDSEDEADENNNEVSNIMGNFIEALPPNFSSVHDDKLKEHHKDHSSLSSATEDLIAEVISGEAEVIPGQNVLGVNFNKVDLSQSTILKVMDEQRKDGEMELKERQWSTFLQKPQRPIITPKPKEVEQPKASSYQVIIKKQKRKNDAIINTLTDTQTDAIPEDVTREESPQTFNITSEPDTEDNLDECRDLENVEYIEQLDESAQNLDDESDEGNNKTDDEVATEIEEEAKPETPPVEDQLIQVQMQLEALARLPSSIQDTLDAVTKQLCKILNATTSRTEENKLPDSAHSSREASVDRTSEASGIEEENNIDITEKQDQFEPTDSLDISERGSNFNDEDNTEVEVISNDYEYDHDLEEEINEEERERLLLEEEKNIQLERKMNPIEESHQRRLEQRPTNPLAPVQRPIILPGGRRWSQPDDALPARKKKSGMSDEKIGETLDMYSETIVGHTKGLTNGMLCGPGLTTSSKSTGSIS